MRILLHTPAGSLHLDAEPGQTLARAIWLSGTVLPPPLCSALGRCGHCRVRFCHAAPPSVPMEDRLLSEQELAQGWRLACRHAVGDLSQAVELALPQAESNREVLNMPGVRPTQTIPLRLAVDLGTTTLHWRAMTTQGDIVAQGQEINPQMGAGSEVMSRLGAARKPEVALQLSLLVTAALQRIMAGLPGFVEEVCVAANTAMTAILLRMNVEGLATAPYVLPLKGDSVESLPGLPPLYIPPQLAPFVGGDVSAGFAALRHRRKPAWPFLLADLGTNGEFVLALNEDQGILASVPLGPALEGIGLTFGDMAGPGVVTAFSLGPDGLAATTWDGGPPRRICGTGYLSLVHALRRTGLLDENGIFQMQPSSPLGRKLAAHRVSVHGEMRLALTAGLYLAAEDVEEILKVKAAFSLALEKMLTAAHLPPGALRAVYLSGALGNHVPAADLEGLGFVPQGMASRLEAMGNSALDGAAHLLLHPEDRAPLARWGRNCRVLDLAADPGFTHTYLRHMRFS